MQILYPFKYNNIFFELNQIIKKNNLKILKKFDILYIDYKRRNMYGK